ncbi:acetyl-CoA carboxylase carboxyltransferase subunit alpha [bacterium]|nr:acetyl-CoA carboxylase carboxyltransferase subunit alpha [bacterium]
MILDNKGWEKVQLARHPKRPYTLDYIERIVKDFKELHGDRFFGDDEAIITGFGKIGNETFAVIGQQKGRSTKENIRRNFGMPNPEGYRKALRIMKLAAKFKKPVLTLIDTPGAFPGIGAEERGQAEAIAKNLFEMAVLPVPIICVIIGEGASGGALGIGVGDRLLMLENSWFSVISPESCSSILWRTWDKKEIAAKALKLTAEDLLEQKIIDEIVKEPTDGAHENYDEIARTVKERVLDNLKELKKLSTDKLIEKRIEKYSKIGFYEEQT